MFPFLIYVGVSYYSIFICCCNPNYLSNQFNLYIYKIHTLPQVY